MGFPGIIWWIELQSLHTIGPSGDLQPLQGISCNFGLLDLSYITSICLKNGLIGEFSLVRLSAAIHYAEITGPVC